MFVSPVYAQCPVCVVTVGGGLFLAKKLGIDDLLVSIWLSGLNTAIAFWIASSMKPKILKNGLWWSIGFFVMTIGYLVFSKQTGHRGNTFLGIDKAILGMIIGLLVLYAAYFVDKLLRYKNKGKVLFYYQKVIIPVSFLLMTTGIMALAMTFIKR